jgi:hypothetical protein
VLLGMLLPLAQLHNMAQPRSPVPASDQQCMQLCLSDAG